MKLIIKEHAEWKFKLSDYLMSEQKTLKVEECHERNCQFAKVLDELEQSGKLKENDLVELKKVHKAFHHTIAELVANINRGVSIDEESALGVDSAFNRNYEALVKLLAKVEMPS
jgi:hypothetical protein